MARNILVFALLVLLLLVAAPGRTMGETVVGVLEQTGGTVPLDLSFRDETGRLVVMRDLLTRPVLLVMTYFSCEHLCPQLLGSLAEALPSMPLTAGVDYSLLTVSFDELDTTARAREVKRNYLAAAGTAFPDAAWKFLTGDRATIGRLTQALGLRFVRREDGFYHPVTLIFLSPGGRISGYLPPKRFSTGFDSRAAFLPTELAMAIDYARAGKMRPSAQAAPVCCFPHERPAELSFFRFLKIFALLNLLAVMGLLAWLLLSRRPGKESDHV